MRNLRGSILLVIISIFFLIIVRLSSVCAIGTDVPMPVDYCAYASDQNITITWKYVCPSGFSCFVEIEEYQSGAWNKIATENAATFTKTFTGQPYGEHRYRMRAKLIYGLITLTSNYTPIFYAYVIKQPSGFTVSVNPPDPIFLTGGSSGLTLKWNPNSNASSVEIWRSKQGSIIFGRIATISAALSSFNDNVDPNTNYSYYIKFIHKDDTNIKDDVSLASAVVSKLSLPATPTNFRANAIDKNILMTWSHTKACDGYKIYRWKTLPTIGWSVIATLDKNTLSYNLTVSEYGQYSFKVTAYNSSGDSPSPPEQEVYSLMKPLGLVATPLSSTSMKLTWSSIDPNATSIRVSYSKDGITYYFLSEFALPRTQIVVESLTPDTKYWFKIIAARWTNWSNSSDPVSEKTLPQGTPPAPPSELIATASSCSKVELSWKDNSLDETGFVIERKEGSGTFGEIATVSSGVNTFDDLTVSPLTTYTYRVRAFNSFGKSVYTDEISVSTPACGILPNPPSDLKVNLVSRAEVHLTWKDNSNDEDSFTLERKTEGTSYSVVKNLSANTIETNDTGLIPGTKYYYRIRTHNTYGFSDYSNEVSVEPPSLTAKPEAPSELSIDQSSCSEVTLNWKDNSVIEENFILERKIEGETYGVISSSISPNTTSYKDNTVEEGKRYYYRIKARNSNGDSEYSNEVSLVIQPCGHPPNAPSNLTLEIASSTEIQIRFQDNSDNEDGFKIERKEPGGTYELIVVLPANLTLYRDSNLQQNKIYYYRVSAYNSYGVSLYSNESSITTPKETTLPSKPTNLIATAISQNEIRVTFTDTSDNEDGFRLERKIFGGSYVETATLPPNTTTFSDKGLQPNTTYYYRVRAYNTKGDSDYSNEANATTLQEVSKVVIRLYIDKLTFYVNDTLKNMDVAPIIKESRTLLPIRYVAEALGANVVWDAIEKKVTITFKETIIELWIDKNLAKVNGEYKLIDPANPKVVPVIIPPGRTMLPIRFIAENLGCDVQWNGELREVKITYPGR
ncbi:fibronectin type III domain-containing protein [Caldisericum exile]|uniref:Fibronectin type-III domain-containing protein n=1 Tax=Caldisericum exile (strain DSM 21853 / NBRC 104410 / AZM16c01) TaxID=511051 RepID=A0A7U6GDE0_CALEA|nr:fibronectin type III domain-containing protein [Caldisericum exile]BAL80363.1 hypothetical protein CSE_02370 [Caldisericum exile AZM16c01]